jgi:hypothetical protein
VKVAELLRELLADLEPEASVKWPEEPAAIADDDLMTPSVQVNEPHVEKEPELLQDKPQLTRPVNPAYAAAEAKAQAFRAMRGAETRVHEESIRRSRRGGTAAPCDLPGTAGSRTFAAIGDGNWGQS